MFQLAADAFSMILSIRIRGVRDSIFQSHQKKEVRFLLQARRGKGGRMSAKPTGPSDAKKERKLLKRNAIKRREGRRG
jgi:hypothetical protein